MSRELISSTLGEVKTLNSTRLRRTVGHTYELIRITPQPAPWGWMLVCAVSTTVPLVVGHVRGENSLAIFGALSGYLMALNDQGGVRRERVWVATLSALAFYVALDIGLRLQGLLATVFLSVGALTYGLGLFAGKGGEMERLLLFTIVQILIARYAFTLSGDSLPTLRFYIGVAYGALLACLIPLAFFKTKARAPIVTLRAAFTLLRTRNRERHAYAAVYALALVLAISYVEYFRIERGYWTIITTLLVMRPDRAESYRRIAQRLFGTLTGVATGELLIHAHPTAPILIAAVFVCTALVPYVWLRNYWLVTFLATNFVVLLLSFAVPGHLDGQITFVRLFATLHGLLIACVSLGLARAVEWTLVHTRRGEPPL